MCKLYVLMFMYESANEIKKKKKEPEQDRTQRRERWRMSLDTNPESCNIAIIGYWSKKHLCLLFEGMAWKLRGARHLLLDLLFSGTKKTVAHTLGDC